VALSDVLARLRGRSDGQAPGRLQLPPVPTSADLLAELDEVEVLVAGAAVPSPVEARVRRVTRVVRDAVPRLDRLGAGSELAYLVMATATDYLPDAVDAYLRLPRDWANTRPVSEGRSSLLVLVDQLDLLAATMDQVLDAVNRQDAAALVAHGEFLAERFARGQGGALGLGDVVAGVPPQPGVVPDPAVAPAPAPASSSEAAAGPDAGPARLTPPDGVAS
jgi:hypothetical protein